METCQFCGMYMKPFIAGTRAECEFCGRTIAEIKKVGEKRKWIKVIPPKETKEQMNPNKTKI